MILLDTNAIDGALADDPRAAALFASGHARCRRWRLASGDRFLLEQLHEEDVPEL